MSISSSAMLVRLSISTWTAKKIDKKQTDDLTVRARADKKAGKVIKDLMVGSNYVSELTKYANNKRNEYSVRTLPWDDMGDRLISTSLYLPFKTDYSEKNGKHSGEFYRRRDYICENYDRLKQISANYLGDMAEEADYPDVNAVYAKYSWELKTKLVPLTGHPYVDLPAQDLDDLRQELEEESKSKVQNAMNTAWDRLHTTLTSMSGKLTENEDDTPKRFYDSFVSNPKELCDFLGHLNVTNDPELDRARVMLQRTMEGADIEVIKDSPAIRENMKSKVDSILGQFDW